MSALVAFLLRQQQGDDRNHEDGPVDHGPPQDNTEQDVVVEPTWRTTRADREYFSQLEDFIAFNTLMFRANPQHRVFSRGPGRYVNHDFHLDAEGRIGRLDLGKFSNGTLWPEQWELSVDHLVQLTNLATLSLTGCRSVPWNALATLPRLATLTIENIIMIDGSVAFISMEEENTYFPNLRGLYFSNCGTIDHDSDAMSQLMAFVTSRFPNLQSLSFEHVREGDLPILLEGLSKAQSCASIKDNLKYLSLNSCNIQEIHLATILLDILPQYANLGNINVGGDNNITSLHGLAERMRKENLDLLPPSVSASRLMLHKLHLYGNPIMSTLTTDGDNQASLMTLLDSFPMLQSLGFPPPTASEPLPPKIEHKLTINRAGRVLLGGGPLLCSWHNPSHFPFGPTS